MGELEGRVMQHASQRAEIAAMEQSLVGQQRCRAEELRLHADVTKWRAAAELAESSACALDASEIAEFRGMRARLNLVFEENDELRSSNEKLRADCLQHEEAFRQAEARAAAAARAWGR